MSLQKHWMDMNKNNILKKNIYIYVYMKLSQIDNELTKYLSWMYANKYIKITLLLLLAAYFVISPKISVTIRLLYNNIIFRILIILLIIFLSMHDYQLAIMLTAVYLLTLNNLNKTEDFTDKNMY